MTHATLRMTRSIRSPRWVALLACSLAAACAGQDPAGNVNGSGGASTGPGTGGAAPQAGADTQGGAGGADTSSTGLGGTNAGGSATGGAGVGGSTGCVDTCPFANGITWQCKKRFFYGLNQAWINFAGDFGGGTRGIAANTSRVGTLFQDYSNNGASVIRWWVWPNFTGGGVAFTGNSATGLKSTTLADLEALMKLADQYNLHLQLTLFSFDNFKTTTNPNLAAIATDAAARAAIVANAIRPLARAAQASAYAKRVISWDVINEPEWAVSGAGANGDQAFTPDTTCTTITQPQMATLLKDVVAGLRAESQALITIGNSAMKWKNAWMAVDQDFYTFHIYDWVQQYWPYNTSPAGYGISAKPVVMGEFPPAGFNNSAITYTTIMSSWYSNGYAGGLPWQDSSMVINFASFKAFADQHPCETRY